jgi:hypothetical protein
MAPNCMYVALRQTVNARPKPKEREGVPSSGPDAIEQREHSAVHFEEVVSRGQQMPVRELGGSKAPVRHSAAR